MIRSLLITTVLCGGLNISACSTERSNTSVYSNQASVADTFQLGLAYFNGDSVIEDDYKAFKLFEQVANQNYAPAQYYLGNMYYAGLGVEKNHKKAFEWYKKAADQGYQPAKNRMTKLITDDKVDGEGVILYSTQDTGFTLSDLEQMMQEK